PIKGPEIAVTESTIEEQEEVPVAETLAAIPAVESEPVLVKEPTAGPAPVMPSISNEEFSALLSEKLDVLLNQNLEVIVERVSEKLVEKLAASLAELVVHKLDFKELPTKAKNFLEEITWEVVPDLASVIIKKEIETIKSQIS
ncbi:hypothetical protein ACFL27_23835, partial [candidate division CSSED10-310 bacterium]